MLQEHSNIFYDLFYQVLTEFIALHTCMFVYICMYVCSVINLQFEMYFITIILFFCNSFKLEGLFVSFPKCLGEIGQKSSLKLER